MAGVVILEGSALALVKGGCALVVMVAEWNPSYLAKSIKSLIL